MTTNILKRSPFTALILALSIALVSCGGDGDSNSGGGQATETQDIDVVIPDTTASTVGPNLNGDNWEGYFKSVEGDFTPMSATIRHVGNEVTILTTKEGIAHKMTGITDGSGNMFMIDEADGEDWTTLYGAASANSINLADFVFVNGSQVDTNIIILKR